MKDIIPTAYDAAAWARAKAFAHAVNIAGWGERGGVYSAPERLYRWSFTRHWSDDAPLACWIGLNPGTRDSEGGDRKTLFKMVAWSAYWRCGGLIVVNLFAYRATKPADLVAARRAGVDIVGDRNDAVLAKETRAGKVALAAWGTCHLAPARAAYLLAEQILPTDRLYCLGTNEAGVPLHPNPRTPLTYTPPKPWPPP